MDKRCTSPDIIEAPSINTAAVQKRLEAIKRQNMKEKSEVVTGNSSNINVNKETTVVMPSEPAAPEEVKKKRGRPRKYPRPAPVPTAPTVVKPDENSANQKSNVKGRQPTVVISRIKETVKKEPVDENEDDSASNTEHPIVTSMNNDPPPEVIATATTTPDKCIESPDITGVSSIFNVKIEPNFGPGYIPGLDLVNYSTENEKPPADFSETFSNISINKKTTTVIKEKKASENPSEPEEKQNEDDSDNKIRRSSRIKTLEEQRGSRGRRREVVFSTSDHLSSSRNSLIAYDEDSNSNESNSMHGSSMSSPTRDGNGASISSSVSSSFSNSTNLFSGISAVSFSSTTGTLKPLKVKSRWRYSLDAENMKSESSNGNSSDLQSSLNTSSDSLLPDSFSSSSGASGAQNNLESYLKERNLIRRSGHIIYEASDTELVDKLKKFEGIDENLFRTDIKISKEGRGMDCDCFLSKEDILRGEIGCNEDCLNRLLMVECGSRCPTGDRCTNRKFQRKEYCLLEVFQTDKKGHGLRTLQPLPRGGFVIEYVGEVLDAREFKHRTKEYAKGKQEHFYFMALKSEAIIDATLRGNCSRFINHSCEPNCETQKWTVNGELRIGFFSIRDLQPGEEITFDYQFQRYGKKAQRCFCMAGSCRGWIGGDEEDENRDLNEPAESQMEMEVEQEPEEKFKEKPKIERKKRKEVQLEDMAFEEELGKLERSGLKNRHHTLTLSRLMVRAEDWDIKERLLKILVNGDAPCRRLFLDYHGLRLIWSWMVDLPLPSQGSEIQLIRNDHYHLLFLQALSSLPIPNKSLLQDSKVLALMEKWSLSPPSTIVLPSNKAITSEATSKLGKSQDIKSVDVPENSEGEVADSSAKNQDVKISPESTCVDEPSDKVDVEENMETTANELHWKFVEVAKSLLDSWADLKEVFRIPKKERVEQMKEHEREADKGMKDSSVSIGYERESRKHRSKGERRVHVIESSQHISSYHRSSNRDRSLRHPNLSKEQRRLIFAEKVAREEQEDKQRKAQDHMVNLHQERCAALGLDASTTPIVDPSISYYLDPKTISWIEIKLDDPNLPPELIPLVQASLYPPPEVFEMLTPEPEFVFPPWPDGLPPPPPLPPSTLPPRWKMAVDDEGRCYYYDIKTRHTQWYPPSPESSEGYGSLSNSSSESDEEEEPVEESLSVSQISQNVRFQTKRSKLNERAEKRKKAGLVQERIISPRLEDERPSISQKSIRAKKQALLEEKLKKLQEAEGIALVQAAEAGLDAECMSPERVVPVKEKHSSRSHGSAAKRRRKESSSRHTMQSKSKSSSKIRTKSHTSASQNLDLSEMLVPESEFETPETASKSNKQDSGTPTVDSIIDIPTDTPATETIPGFMTDEERAAMAAANASSATSSKKSERPKGSERERKRHHAGHKKEREKDNSTSEKRSKEANKDSFRNQIANVIVTHLNPYRKPDCKHGRIVSTDDFKHLARKMTHAILLKELKHTRDAKSLEVNDSVRHKTKEYVKKFMGRFPNSSYVRSPEDTQGK